MKCITPRTGRNNNDDVIRTVYNLTIVRVQPRRGGTYVYVYIYMYLYIYIPYTRIIRLYVGPAEDGERGRAGGRAGGRDGDTRSN